MTTTTRRTAASLIAGIATVATLTAVAAVSSPAASAHRPVSDGPVAGCGAAVERGDGYDDHDPAREVERRKATLAQWYIDHAAELHQRTIR